MPEVLSPLHHQQQPQHQVHQLRNQPRRYTAVLPLRNYRVLGGGQYLWADVAGAIDHTTASASFLLYGLYTYQEESVGADSELTQTHCFFGY